MRVTNKDLISRTKRLENYLGFPKGMEFEIRSAYGKVGLSEPGTNNSITGLMTKKELYDTLGAIYEGMYMYKERVKLKKKFKKYSK
jgi:hypothetical protein